MLIFVHVPGLNIGLEFESVPRVGEHIATELPAAGLHRVETVVHLPKPKRRTGARSRAKSAPYDAEVWCSAAIKPSKVVPKAT